LLVSKTFNHYLIEEKLGEGGMGVVYRARDTRLDRPVAVKVLPHDKVADPERKRRFIQEAKAASALNHPNIITIYDIDQAEGTDFIVMEYVDGETLDDLIGRKGLRVGEALKYAIQVADALTAAHAAGIVHRDLKPGNVIVTAKGHVKVLDFGLAKLLEALPAGANEPTLTLKPATEEGRIVGTIAYMSPEQAEGKKVDARSDIFSFGSLLYEMVTGRRAFQGESSASTIAAILKDNPKPASQMVEGFPREVERLINRCLRKDVSQRFQHMDDVKIALEELKEESDSGVLTADRPVQTRRHSYLRFLVAFFVIAGLAFAAWLLSRGNPKQMAPFRTTVLTSYPGIETSPNFSPDGNQVAFSWNGERQDNYDIYIKLVASPGCLRLTTDPAWDGSPAFSPDGQSIAFIRILKDRFIIIQIPAIGGTERTLAEIDNVGGLSWLGDVEWFGGGGPSLAWFPDGQWIAAPGLALISATTREVRRLTSLLEDTWSMWDPAVSPDGRTLAFSYTYSPSIWEIYLLNLTADLKPEGEPRRLTFLNRNSSNPVWTANGREIVFSSSFIFRPSLWYVAAFGSGEPQPLLPAGGEDSFPAISRQGNRLAFSRKITDINMGHLTLSKSGSMGNPPELFLYSSRDELNPQFSLDGRKIVFESSRTGVHGIWVSNADGTNAVEVFSQPGKHAGTPRWAPDGQRLVFDANIDGELVPYIMLASGGKPIRLAGALGGDIIPSWSSDGNWIYFTSARSGRSQIWKAPVEGGEAVQVTKNTGQVAFESRDGRFVYFTSSGADSSLWRVPVGGGEERQLLPSVFLRNYAVMDDGLYFIPRPDAGGKASLQFFDFATNTVKTVASLSGRLAIGMTVSPDRLSVIYSRIDESGSDLVLIENFR
jgi:serine/threonine protein kinase